MNEITLVATLQRLSTAYAPMLEFLKVVSYVLGALCCVWMLFALHKAGERRPGEGGTLMTPVWVNLGMAIIFFTLPSFLQAGGNQIFGGTKMTSPLVYEQVNTGGTGTLAPLVGLLQLIGFVAAIRGLLTLRAVGLYGSHSRGNASFGKGITLIVAGILLIHMQDTLALVANLTGISVGLGLF